MGGRGSWCGVICISADIQDIERTREDGAIMLNYVWQCVGVDLGYLF